MKLTKVAGAVLAVASGVCIAAAQTTVTNIFEDINKVIPDGATTGVSDTQILTFTEPSFSSITEVGVILTISGGFNGDLYGYLVHDTGFSVLLNRVGRTADNSIGYPDAGLAVFFSDSGSDIHNYRDVSFTLNGSGQLTGSWAPDGRTSDPAAVLNTDLPVAMLSSFNGLDPNGSWTLFLADLDFGEQATLVNWGLVVTAIPEPSAAGLIFLGGLALGIHVIRRRK